MTGERTASNRPHSVHNQSNSDDHISLREHMQRQLESEISHVISYFNERVDNAIHAHDRHAVEQDRRYQARYEAQEKAVELALTRVDRELQAHFHAAREEVHAALASADKAIAKSEASTDKRFDSVNEFRAQLSDQAATFMMRSESLARHDRTAEQVSEMAGRHENDIRMARERFESDLTALRQRFESDIATINSRLDRNAGTASGLDKAWGYLIGGIGLAGAVVGIIIGTR
jgi:hypothetical protein